MNQAIFFRMCLAVAMLSGASSLAQAQTKAEADPITPLVYDVNSRESAATMQKGTCPLRVLATEDQRLNKQTIGASLSGPLLTGEASPWVTDGLLHLKDFGYTVEQVEPGASPGEGLLVKTSITRAYTWQVGFKLFSMIALKAQITGKDGVVQEKYYRAHGDKTNMWGAASEYVTTLNFGLNNLLRVMAEDLSAVCQGKQVEIYSYAGPEAKPTTNK